MFAPIRSEYVEEPNISGVTEGALKLQGAGLIRYARGRITVIDRLGLEPEDEAAEYAPQVVHSLVTGTPRTIQANVANAGLITNLQRDLSLVRNAANPTFAATSIDPTSFGRSSSSAP